MASMYRYRIPDETLPGKALCGTVLQRTLVAIHGQSAPQFMNGASGDAV